MTTEWTYDKATREEMALRAAGYIPVEQHFDDGSVKYDWVDGDKYAIRMFCRFNSREQARSYAHRFVVELGRVI